MGMSKQSHPDPSDDDFLIDFSVDSFDDDYMLDMFIPGDAPIEDQLALDTLLDQGFTWEEGIRLILFREHLDEVGEVIEHITEEPHIKFTKWLYQRGILQS